MNFYQQKMYQKINSNLRTAREKTTNLTQIQIDQMLYSIKYGQVGLP